MVAPLPYADLVGSEDPLSLLTSTPNRIAELVSAWDMTQWSRTYEPDGWTAAQIILHLAHDEIGWCNRVRLALTVDAYVVQPYDGAQWVTMETPTDPQIALATYLALRRLNLILYKRISAEQRVKAISHPDLGEISIDWIVRTLAGHDLHHLQHLLTIAAL